MIKKIVYLIFCMSCSFGSLFYGYYLGFCDSASTMYLADMCSAWRDMIILRKHGSEHLEKYLDSNLNSTATIFKTMVDKESFLSKILGPERARINDSKTLLSYYRPILEYRKENPFDYNDSNLMEGLQVMVKQLVEYDKEISDER